MAFQYFMTTKEYRNLRCGYLGVIRDYMMDPRLAEHAAEERTYMQRRLAILRSKYYRA